MRAQLLRHDSFIYIEIFDYNAGHLITIIVCYIFSFYFLLSKSARNIWKKCLFAFLHWSLNRVYLNLAGNCL